MAHSPQERAELVGLARRAIRAELGLGPPPDVEGAIARGLDAPSGCFVTVRHRGRLRGCRGILATDDPLARTVSETAVLTAFDDPRFPPIAPDEADGLEVEVSVLGPPRLLADPARLDVGREGALLTARGRRGFLLPQVATDHGLDARAFLEALCTKAGLPKDAWQDPDVRVEAFDVEHFGDASEPEGAAREG